MKKTIKRLRNIKKGIVGSALMGTIPYILMKEGIKELPNYIKKPPNPIRRAMRVGEITTYAILTSPLTLLVGVGYPAIGIIGITGCIVGGTLYIPLGALGDGVKWGVNGIDDFIDRFNEIPNDLPPQIQATTKIDSYAVMLKELDANEIKITHIFTPYMESYIQSFHQKTPYSVQIENLQLTDEEKLRFEEYLDPITKEFMDIPVKLNDHIYDLNTLLKCFEKYGQDPINNIPFELSHISAERNTSEKIQALIILIQKERTIPEYTFGFELPRSRSHITY